MVRIMAAMAVVVALAVPAWAQVDPNLLPNAPGVPAQRPPNVAPEDWQLAREEIIGGRRYLVVRDAEGYIEQMGWDRETTKVYPKERTGLTRDLILSPDQSRIEPTGGIVVKSGGHGTHIRATYQWNASKRRLELIDFKRTSGGFSGKLRIDHPLNAPDNNPVDGQYSPGIVETPGEIETGEEPPVIQSPVLTLGERARTELGIGDPELAAALYREHLDTEPGDVEAMRALGLAQLKCGRYEDAASWVLQAYATDPVLAERPLGVWIAGDSVLAMRRLRVEALKHAGRANTPGACLVVVVLMQGEGKAEAAMKMLERAEALGLDAAVVSAMRASLAGP